MIRNIYRPSTLQVALRGLVNSVNPSYHDNTSIPKARNNPKTNRNKKVQAIGRHFVPRNISGMTPAQYRRLHMGSSKKKA